MFCCHDLEILIVFEQGPHIFHFALGRTNNLARSAQGWLFLKYFREACILWLENEIWMQIDLWRNHGSTTLDKPLSLSKPQFPHLSNGADFDTCIIGSLRGLNETMHVKHLEFCLQRQMFDCCCCVLAIAVDLDLLQPWCFTAHPCPVFIPCG